MNTSSISRRVWVIRCRWPFSGSGSAGSVTSTRSRSRRAVSSPAASSRRRLLDQRLERLAGLVGGLAGRGALLRGETGDGPEQVRELGLAPEVPDPDLLERVRSSVAAIACSASLRICAIRSTVGVPRSGRSSLTAFIAVISRAILVSSYSATVAAIAAFSEFVSIGMWAT